MAKLKKSGHGWSNGAVFFRPEDDSPIICHGDDPAMLGDEIAVKRFEEMLRKWCTVRGLVVLGVESGDDKHATSLSWVLTAHAQRRPWILVYQHESRHAKLVASELGLERRREQSDWQSIDVSIDICWSRSRNIPVPS